MQLILQVSLEVALTVSMQVPMFQRPKKSQFSGRQTFTRKNFPDEARKLFPRHICRKWVNGFHDINGKSHFCDRYIVSVGNFFWWLTSVILFML